MGRVIDVVLVLVAIPLAGCGSGNDGPAPVTPPEACQNVVDALCNKEAECAVPTDRARTREDCEFFFWVQVDCSTVRGIGPTYAICLRDIAQISCASFDPNSGPPDSCHGIMSQ
jgi:hypothetical protein